MPSGLGPRPGLNITYSINPTTIVSPNITYVLPTPRDDTNGWYYNVYVVAVFRVVLIFAIIFAIRKVQEFRSINAGLSLYPTQSSRSILSPCQTTRPQGPIIRVPTLVTWKLVVLQMSWV